MAITETNIIIESFFCFIQFTFCLVSVVHANSMIYECRVSVTWNNLNMHLFLMTWTQFIRTKLHKICVGTPHTFSMTFNFQKKIRPSLNGIRLSFCYRKIKLGGCFLLRKNNIVKSET